MPGALIVVLAALGALLLVLVNKAKGSPTETVSGSIKKYPYQSEINNAASQYNVPADLVAAVIAWETRGQFNADATNPNDPSYGLGQVTPYIAVRFNIIKTEGDFIALYDPQTNCNAVAAYLDYLLNEKGYLLSDAIQMYNEGEPNFEDGHRVPDYLNGVIEYYDQYRGT